MPFKLYYTYSDQKIVNEARQHNQDTQAAWIDMDYLVFSLDHNRPAILRHPERYIHRHLLIGYNEVGDVLVAFFLTSVKSHADPNRAGGMWECIFISELMKGENNG